MTVGLMIWGMDGDRDHRVVRLVDDGTAVEVHADDGDLVRVKFVTETGGVTLVGDLDQLHRVIVEADRQVARLTVRPVGRGSG